MLKVRCELYKVKFNIEVISVMALKLVFNKNTNFCSWMYPENKFLSS